jgi:hypothetical protein
MFAKFVCVIFIYTVSSVFCCIQNSVLAVNSFIAMTDIYKQNSDSILGSGCGVHATPYPVGTVRSFFLGVERPGLEADYLSSAEVKSGGSVPPFLHTFYGVVLY